MGDFRDRVAEEINGMRQRLGQRSGMRSDQVGSASPPTTAVKTEHIEFEEAKNGDLLRSLHLAQSPGAEGSPHLAGSVNHKPQQSRQQSQDGVMKPTVQSHDPTTSKSFSK